MEIKRIAAESFTSLTHPFQSVLWSEAKRENSWRSDFFSVSEEGLPEFKLLVLTRSFFHGLIRFSYIPMSPPLALVNIPGAVNRLARGLVPFLPKNVFCLRFDFPFDYNNLLGWKDSSETELEQFYREFSRREGLFLLDHSIQPQGTVFNDLNTEFSYRTRARRFLKKNAGNVRLSFWENDVQVFENWYGIYLETARRDGFTPRSSSYIKRLLDLDSTGNTYCRLMLAEVDSVLCGGIVVIGNADVETYLFGGARRSQEFNVSYCLQDFALKEAVRRGVKFYDFYGAHGTGIRDSHLNSLTQFKLAFGGRLVYRIPSCDYVSRRFIWKLYHTLESRRLKNSRD